MTNSDGRYKLAYSSSKKSGPSSSFPLAPIGARLLCKASDSSLGSSQCLFMMVASVVSAGSQTTKLAALS